MPITNIRNSFIQFLKAINYTLITVVLISHFPYNGSFTPFTFVFLIGAGVNMSPDFNPCANKFAVWLLVALDSFFRRTEFFIMFDEILSIGWKAFFTQIAEQFVFVVLIRQVSRIDHTWILMLKWVKLLILVFLQLISYPRYVFRLESTIFCWATLRQIQKQGFQQIALVSW